MEQWLIFGPLVVGIVLLPHLRIAGDHERFAVFNLGRFSGLKGPGLVINFFLQEQLVRLKLGDRGELVASDVGRFHHRDIPIQCNDTEVIGSKIRIAAFSDGKIIASLDGDQRRTFYCKKCGHENTF